MNWLNIHIVGSKEEAAPGWDNAYLATGAGRKGILISPGMGKAIADLLTAGETALSVGEFGAGRFGDR